MQPESNTAMVQWESLREFMIQVFSGAGMPHPDAVTEADSLIWANLRGVDSHGVVRVPWYLDNIDLGVMNPRPEMRVISETPATVLLEADRAFGPVATVHAAELAIEKAATAGVGWVLIRNVTHQGAIGQYAQQIAKKDMVGLVITGSQPNMVPYGARGAGVGNNPMAICVPAARHHLLLLDMATSLVALGKVLVARESGRSMPEGWGLDKDGNPTTDPGKLAALLPMAGPKGSGMAVVFECIASIMAGNALIQPVLAGVFQSQKVSSAHVAQKAPHNQNSAVIALNVSCFIDVEGFKAGVDDLVDSIKALPTADGFDEIVMPGELEERRCAERMKNGIPVPPGTVIALRAIATRLGLTLPSPLS